MKKSLFLVLFMVVIGAAKAGLDHELQVQLNSQLKRALPDGGIAYHSAYVAPLRAGVVVEQLSVQRPELPPLTLERLELTQLYSVATAASLHAKVSGLRLSVPAYPDVSALFTALGYGDYYLSGKDLARLGYGTLHGDLELDMRHAAAAQQLHIDLRLTNSNLGTWQAQLIVDKVPQLPLNAHWSTLPLQRADLYLHTQPVLGRVLGDIARRTGQAPAARRQAFAEQVRRDLGMLRQGLDNDSLDALAALLRADTPLHLQAVPPEPIPAQVLLRYMPLQWPALLGLRILPPE